MVDAVEVFKNMGLFVDTVAPVLGANSETLDQFDAAMTTADGLANHENLLIVAAEIVIGAAALEAIAPGLLAAGVIGGVEALFGEGVVVSAEATIDAGIVSLGVPGFLDVTSGTAIVASTATAIGGVAAGEGINDIISGIGNFLLSPHPISTTNVAGTVNVNNSNNAVVAQDDSIVAGSAEDVAVIGNDNSLYANGNDVIATYGTGNNVTAATGAHAVIYGFGDSIDAGTNSTVTLFGTGNTIALANNSALTFDGVDNAITVGEDATAKVIGNNANITVLDNATLNLTGGHENITLYSGATVNDTAPTPLTNNITFEVGGGSTSITFDAGVLSNSAINYAGEDDYTLQTLAGIPLPGYLTFDSALGPVNVTVTTPVGSSTSTATLAAYAPSFSLFTAKYPAAIVMTPGSPGNSGAGYDIIGPSGAFSFASRPVKPGEILILFGVGFGPTNPTVPAGELFSGAAPSITNPQILIGNMPATVQFAGIIEAGLFQFNVVVPGAPSGDQILTANIAGVSTQPGVTITLQ